MRIIKPQNPNYYMIIIEFRSQHHADHFYMSTNSQQFNSVEPERCYAVFIQDIKFIEPTNERLFKNNDLKELPSCPVCLERLDAEESGLLTSICNHEFHSNCLAQCDTEINCPVCRYSFQQNESNNICSDCDATENLWICLLCGNIGCSRYRNEHAELHFKSTGHTYSLEIDTQRVWDYAGDGYVHRLIQNNADGKLVEVADPNSPCNKGLSEKGKSKTTMDALVVEYNYLLTSQLESQRVFYEQREAEKDAYIRSLEEKINTVSNVIPSHHIEESKKETEKKISQLSSKVGNLQAECQSLRKEVVFLKDINYQLEQNQDEWKKKIDSLEQTMKNKISAKEEKITELQSELNDLMLHLDAAHKISKQPDMEDGAVLNLTSPIKPKPNTGKRRKRNK